ncbi:MAG: guanine permease [Bdellovibrionales bacterium GWA2_49_15]|nr:MAG: guanine permease [Bdellovibrionales bacterium GWA2_49_15]HAZ14922.1 guanine permease [Bdellovibrionales bacterium]
MHRFFGIHEAKSSPRTEILGGIATFLTMAYIIFVNPAILSEAIPGVADNPLLREQFFGAFMVATIVSMASATLIMGLLANYPFALAPGMGLNAYFTYVVCLKMGIDWRDALGAVFVEGIIFILLTLAGARVFIVRAIPRAVKFSSSAGIGIFLAFIGLKGAGLISADPNTFVTLGKLTSPEAVTCIIGLLIITTLFAFKIPGSVLLGILVATIFGSFVGVTHFKGIVGPIPDISPTFFKLQVSWESLTTPAFWIVVMTFFFADFFDTAGTLTGLSNAAGFADKDGNLPRGGKAYMADAIGTALGALFGTSTVTTYIESGAGIAQGARTGLASVVTALFMLSALFFAPLAMSIPAAATAPALIFIGALMMVNLKDLEWNDVTEALPAFITIVAMPLTFSIANGIALGIITFTLVKLCSGKLRQIHWLTGLLSFAFILYFIYLH